MSVRRLPEELQAKAKDEINEDPARINDDLEHIKIWLKKQQHLNARTDDQWLLNFFRGCKFSLERTKEKLEKFYMTRTMIPEFFKDRDPKKPEIQTALKRGPFLILKKSKDLLAPRVCITRPGGFNPSENSAEDDFMIYSMILDINIMEDDSSFVNGIRVVYDWKYCKMEHMISPVLAKKFVVCFQDSYPYRVKAVHLINLPSFVDVVLNMIRPFLSEKIKSRITVHGVNDLVSFREVIPKDILPKDYGGEGDSLEDLAKIWKKKVEEYREWFLDDAKYGTDEEKRLGKPKTPAEMFGVEGSFRRLSVD